MASSTSATAADATPSIDHDAYLATVCGRSEPQTADRSADLLRVETADVEDNCCCDKCPILTGARLVAATELGRNALTLAFLIYQQFSPDFARSTADILSLAFGCTLLFCFCLSCSMMIYGLHARNRHWMLPHMIAQPCAFVYYFVLSIHLLVAHKNCNDIFATFGMFCAVLAAVQLWFCTIVFRAHRFFTDVDEERREIFMSRAYYNVIMHLMQLTPKKKPSQCSESIS